MSCAGTYKVLEHLIPQSNESELVYLRITYKVLLVFLVFVLALATRRVVRAQDGLDDKALLRQAYGAAFHRAPRAAEVSAAVEFLKEQGRLYPQDSRTRAWKDLLHTLMNVKEFIFIN